MEVLDRALIDAGLWPARAADESILRIDAAALLDPPTASADARATWRRRHGQALPKNLILVTIDALRADATGLVDGGISHTPRLDALARTGASFPKAWSQAPATAGSMESFLTGRYPSRTPVASALRVGRVTEEAPGLATLVGNQGFDTAWFTGLSDTTLPSVVWDRLKRGFDQVMGSPGGPGRRQHTSGQPYI